MNTPPGSPPSYEVLGERVAGQERLINEMSKRFAQEVNSLKDMILAQKDSTALALTAQAKESAAALASADKAVSKADVATEKRFDAVNEFRATLTDQTATFIGRGEYLATIKSLNDKLDELKTRLDALGGRSAGISQGWATLVGIALLAIAIYAALRPR